jgi:quinol monooxygenase YgiN
MQELVIRVVPAGREELVSALGEFFEGLVPESTFVDATVLTSRKEPDLVFVIERWRETKESFV